MKRKTDQLPGPTPGGAEQRRVTARLLLESVADDGRSKDEIRLMLRTRLEDLKSGRDPGMSFEQVFGAKA